MSTNVLARRVVERRAPDLLEMLGLVAEDGSTPPDDTNEYAIIDVNKGPGAKNPDSLTTPSQQRRGMTTPEGLLAPPEQAKPKRAYTKSTKPRKKPEKVAKCGTYAGFQRHYRVEKQRPVTCPECIQARKDSRRDYMADYRARKAGKA